MFKCNNSCRVKEFQVATPGKMQSVVDIFPSRVAMGEEVGNHLI